MRHHLGWSTALLIICMVLPLSVSAETFLLDPGTYRLGDGWFGPYNSGTSSHPVYSIPFHLAKSTRLRILVGDVRPIDSQASVVRFMGGMMTFGTGFLDMGNFGAEMIVARLTSDSSGDPIYRAPLVLAHSGGPYLSDWTAELLPGDYVLSLRSNYNEILAEFDDFIFSEVTVEVSGQGATVARLGPGRVHTLPFRLEAAPNRQRDLLARLHQRRAEDALIMNLVEAKTRVLALELEVQQLRSALKRTGVGFKPPPAVEVNPIPSP